MLRRSGDTARWRFESKAARSLRRMRDVHRLADDRRSGLPTPTAAYEGRTVRHALCIAPRMQRTTPWLAIVLAASISAPQDPAPSAPDPQDLLGRPFATALARLGPPDHGTGTGGLVHWTWSDDAGGSIRIAMHDGLVVHVDLTRRAGAAQARATPGTGAYPGQSVPELLERLGSPLRVVEGMAPPSGPGLRGAPGVQAPAIRVADALFVYPTARLQVSAGFVLGPEPVRDPVSGPR